MKLLLHLIVGVFCIQIGVAQDEPQKLNLRGPVPPSDLSYADYKTYSMTVNVSPGIEKSIKRRKGAYSKTTIEALFGIDGLKKVEKGDFSIIYNVKRFELVEESYLPDSYERAPLHYIGLESDVEIQDKNGKTIFRRFTVPKVNRYVVNKEAVFELLVNKILKNDFNSLLDQFEAFYLYGPAFNDLRYFTIEKNKKSKSSFNSDEFNQSVQVLPALVDVDRANWAGLFSEAQSYWKTLLNFNEPKDEGLQKRVRFAANYNLAATYLLLGREDEAERLWQGVKDNETSFLGQRKHAPYIQETIAAIRNYRKDTDKVSHIEAIEPQPVLRAFQQSENAFKFAEFAGEVKESKGELYRGKIIIYIDSPELIDWRGNKDTGSMLGNALKAIGTDDSKVVIFVDGQKKPIKSKFSDIEHIRDDQGHVYVIGKTGRSSALADAGNTKRYAMFEEVRKDKKLILFQEFLPETQFSIKKATQEDFISLPLYIGRRKALKEYFPECKIVMMNVDKGEYDVEKKETYVKLFEDYTNGCGKK